MSNVPLTSQTRDVLPSRPVLAAVGVRSLPRPLTSFIGRETEIEAVCGLVSDPDVRLLSLTGPGGVGKTRIAIRVAESMDGFAHGIVFVPLGSIMDASLVPAIVARQLGVPDSNEQPLSRRIGAYLQSKSILLVLDNFEHLPETALFAADLLDHSEGLKILVTSRTKIGLSGERVIPVSSLDAGSARELFEQRARANIPDFSLPDSQVPVVEEICAKLDGLPLAIELAAARINVLTPAALLHRIEHRLSILIGGPKDAPTRHQTMRNTIAWSHELLNQGEQELLRRLSVFVGGFTLEAAEAVAGEGPDVLGGISALLANSLIKRVPEPYDEPRFAMLETIREFAWEQLIASGEANQTRDAHARYCLYVAESALPFFDGPELRAHADRVEAELDNCRAAMAWSLETGDYETELRLAGALWRMWWPGHAIGGQSWLGRVAEGLTWIEQGLPYRDGLPVSTLAEALTGAAQLNRMLDRPDRGLPFAHELLSRCEGEGFAYGELWSCFVLGMAAIDSGEYESSRSWLQRALGLAPQIRNPINHEALILGNLADVAQFSGSPDAAIELFEEALAKARQCGNPHGIAWMTIPAGRLHLNRGDLQEAGPLLTEGLATCLEMRDLGVPGQSSPNSPGSP